MEGLCSQPNLPNNPRVLGPLVFAVGLVMPASQKWKTSRNIHAESLEKCQSLSDQNPLM